MLDTVEENQELESYRHPNRQKDEENGIKRYSTHVSQDFSEKILNKNGGGLVEGFWPI